MALRDLSGAVDFTVLETMVGDDLATLDEVLALFCEQAALWSGALDPAGEGWRDAAHALKGTAAGIGAHALQGACDEVERADPALASAAITRLHDRLAEALTDVAAYRHALMLRTLKA
ncbi:MAG: Hpt domain-containing protein [Brevundimonas sp.]|uniref:Hpt domain-containing protein n=1 Tax=Brevundimonas sp. TaxID=1871086 RepID=UPI00391BE3A5